MLLNEADIVFREMEIGHDTFIRFSMDPVPPFEPHLNRRGPALYAPKVAHIKACLLQYPADRCTIGIVAYETDD